MNQVLRYSILVFALFFVALWLSAHIGAFLRQKRRDPAEAEREDFGVVVAATGYPNLGTNRVPTPAPKASTSFPNLEGVPRYHLNQLVSIDFSTVPTATFKVLFVLVVLAHRRRRVIHFSVTEHPTAAWTAQQILDRDQIYGECFRNRLRDLSITEVLTAPQSPWQTRYWKGWWAPLWRECLDHVIVLGEKHLRRILKSYFDSYLGARTHLPLAKDAPTARVVQGPEAGEIVENPAGRRSAPSLRTARCMTDATLGLLFL